jgi:hypothetical protein
MFKINSYKIDYDPITVNYHNIIVKIPFHSRHRDDRFDWLWVTAENELYASQNEPEWDSENDDWTFDRKKLGMAEYVGHIYSFEGNIKDSLMQIYTSRSY